jgi:hypothetical protein
MELTVTVMTFIIFLISLAAWALIGLVFWIPIMTRATTVFSGMILYATLTHQKADALGEYLRLASGFYANGFRITTEALYPPKGTPSASAIEFRVGHFITELLWTTAFWLTVLWIGQPNLIRPLTARISNIAEGFWQIVTSFPVLIVAIIIGVIFLSMWGAYLWNRFNVMSNSLSRSKRSSFTYADIQSPEIHHKLEKISRSLQDLSELSKATLNVIKTIEVSRSQDVAAPTIATPRPPIARMQPTAEKRDG